MEIIKVKESGENFKDFYDALSTEAKELWDEFEETLLGGASFKQLREWQMKLQPYGIYYDYGLDTQPFDIVLVIKE